MQKLQLAYVLVIGIILVFSYSYWNITAAEFSMDTPMAYNSNSFVKKQNP